MNDLLNITLRSSVVYICIVLFFRLFGKKEMSQLSVIDLVFILLISNSVQNSMVGSDTSLQGGLIAAFTLFGLNTLFHYVILRSKSAAKFLEGSPVILIYEGKIAHANLEKVQITKAELEAIVREHGLRDNSEVDLAVLEVDGNVSILSENYSRKSIKHKHYKGFQSKQG